MTREAETPGRMDGTEAQSSGKKYRLTLCGSFGWGHARDLAVALAIQDLALAEGYSVELDLLGGKRAGALGAVIGLGEEDQERLQELRGQPTLVTGQGVIEPSSHAILLRCAPYLKPPFTPWASLFGASVEMGVSYPWLTRWRLRSLLKRMRRLLVADVESQAQLQRLAPSQKVMVIGDPCLSLRAGPNVAPEVSHLDRYVVVALAPRWSRSPEWHRWISRRLIELSDRLDATIVFLPMSIARDDDRPEADTVAREMIRHASQTRVVCINRLLPPREMARTLGKSILVVGMRLHPCVLSYSQSVPFVALLQHPRIASFAATMGCRQNVFPPGAIEPSGRQAYGYHFSDLPMGEGSLTQAALNAMHRTSFASLEKFQRLQRSSLTDLLLRMNPEDS